LSVLVTTNEPEKVRNLFVDRIECPMKFDFMLYTEAGKIGIERKKVPGDLLSSVGDGRLTREISAMREECLVQIILLHGKLSYRSDGTVNTGREKYGRAWTEKGVRHLFWTIQFVEGCYIEVARNDQELVDTINELQRYFDTTKHLSLKGRPGIHKDWIVPTKEERLRYFYDGLPGIGVVSAKALCKVFTRPLDLYQATPGDIMKVPGFGKTTSNQIYDFLRGV